MKNDVTPMIQFCVERLALLQDNLEQESSLYSERFKMLDSISVAIREIRPYLRGVVELPLLEVGTVYEDEKFNRVLLTGIDSSEEEKLFEGIVLSIQRRPNKFNIEVRFNRHGENQSFLSNFGNIRTVSTNQSREIIL